MGRRIKRSVNRESINDRVFSVIGISVAVLVWPFIWEVALVDYFPNQDIGRRVGLGLLVVMLFGRAASLDFGQPPWWASLYYLPIDPATIHRYRWRDTFWDVVMVFVENAVIVLLVTLYCSQVLDWIAIIVMVFLLSWIQIGIAIVFRRYELPHLLGKFCLWCFCVTLVGLVWHFVRKLSDASVDEGFFRVLASVFDHLGWIFPTGWPFRLTDEIGSANFNWIAVVAIALLFGLPWLWIGKLKALLFQQVKKVSYELTSIKDREFEDELFDEDEEDDSWNWERMEESVLVCEETGERHEAWQDNDGNWKIVRKLHTECELREKAANNTLFEVRDFSSKGWIERMCWALLKTSERNTIDVALQKPVWYAGEGESSKKGVRYTQKLLSRLKWVLGFILFALLWLVIGANWASAVCIAMCVCAGIGWGFYLFHQPLGEVPKQLPVSNLDLRGITQKVHLVHLPGILLMTLIVGIWCEYVIYNSLDFRITSASLVFVISLTLLRAFRLQEGGVSVSGNRFLKRLLMDWNQLASVGFCFASIGIGFAKEWFWAIGLWGIVWAHAMLIQWLRDRI